MNRTTTKLDVRVATDLASARRSLALDRGLRATYRDPGVFPKVKRSGDMTLLHDYLKSLVRHGLFEEARQAIRSYVEMKKRGCLP